jgi:hypothetical protein
MPIEAMLMGPLSGRRGHKPSELTAPSSSFTAAITNSYVCAIEKLRHSTFRTLSNLLRVKTPDTGNSKLVSTSQLSKIGWIVRSSTCNCLNQSRRLMTAVTILPAATTTEVIGALEVAIRVIKGVARAEHRVVAMVIQAAVCVRAANSKVDQEEKTPGVDAIEVCLPQYHKRPDQPDHKQQKTIQAASKRDMLLLYFQYGVYDSPIPASFIRSAPPIMAKAAPPLSPRAIHTYTLYECLSIVLTSEIGRGATGVVHRWRGAGISLETRSCGIASNDDVIR